MSEPYNAPVKAITYNRILLFLAFVGVFLAGVLTLEKVLGVSLPCGPAKGCDIIANHPSSVVGGKNGVPTAAFGLVAYIAFAGFAISRSLYGFKKSALTTTLGYVAAALGTIISIGLQVYALAVIHATCIYCLASAVTMTITLIFYALLTSAVDDMGEEEETVVKKDYALIGALAVVSIVAALAMGFSSSSSQKIAAYVPPDIAKKVDLVPKDAHIFGSETAPVTIIEFADICCPTCQKTSPLVKDLVRNNRGRIRLVYRHFPLQMHKLGSLAATMAEYAATKGKFWEFLETSMAAGNGTIIEDTQILLDAAKKVGLDTEDLQKHIQNDKDPIYDVVTRDLNAANAIGIQGTPTFMVLVPGKDPKAFTASGMKEYLDSKEVQAVINGK